MRRSGDGGGIAAASPVEPLVKAHGPLDVVPRDLERVPKIRARVILRDEIRIRPACEVNCNDFSALVKHGAATAARDGLYQRPHLC